VPVAVRVILVLWVGVLAGPVVKVVVVVVVVVVSVVTLVTRVDINVNISVRLHDVGDVVLDSTSELRGGITLVPVAVLVVYVVERIWVHIVVVVVVVVVVVPLVVVVIIVDVDISVGLHDVGNIVLDSASDLRGGVALVPVASLVVDVVERIRVHVVVVLVVVVIIVVVVAVVVVNVDVGVSLDDVHNVILNAASELRSWSSSGDGEECGEAGAVLDESH